MARLAQGTKVLTEGGPDKVFHQAFQMLPGEKLLNSFACYLSTSSGPVMGTLYVSNKRIAFCSDYPFWYYSSTGNAEWMHYKVWPSLLVLLSQALLIDFISVMVP